MRSKQEGVSLGALMIVMFILIFVAVLGFKLIPSYMEFGRAKSAIETIARNQASSVAEARKAFDARATVDDIGVIKGSDLEITKEGNEVVIRFGYRKEIPLFANVGMFIDFAANSKGE
jgi:hypothetical protein